MGSLKAEVARLQTEREQLVQVVQRQQHDLQESQAMVRQLAEVVFSNPALLRNMIARGL
jgi:hypothetical protein